MTTIAWDGKTLVGDTLGVSYNLKRQVVKVWRLDDGRLYGASGEYQSVLAVKAWLEAGELEDKKPNLDDFSGLLIDHKGQCFRLEDQLIYMPIAEQYHAVGTGRDFAMAAMFLGASAMNAVLVASHFDVYTDTPFTTVALNGTF